jgi:hypothetical protein
VPWRSARFIFGSARSLRGEETKTRYDVVFIWPHKGFFFQLYELATRGVSQIWLQVKRKVELLKEDFFSQMLLKQQHFFNINLQNIFYINTIVIKCMKVEVKM